jgi:cell division protein FtsN
MTRKTSTATRRSAQRRNYGGTLIGVFIGLVIGLLCAFGIAWYLQKTPLPFQDKGMQDRAEMTQPAAAPLQLPGKPGQKPVNSGKNDVGAERFEFYKILPSGQMSPAGSEGAVTTATDKDAPSATPKAAPDNATPVAATVFYLQAGAFQKSVDANNQKAKLALMGFETSVFEAETPDKGMLYRVRVGPFATPEEMNLARNQLSESGIQASVVKIKNAPQ